MRSMKVNQPSLLRLFFAVLPLAALPSHAEDLDYAISLGKVKDEAEMTRTEGSLEVKIKSPGGIGTAKLSLRREGARWPKLIVLLIRLDDGKPLKELEGISLQGKKLRVTGSRRTSGQMDGFELGPGEKADPGVRKPRKVDVKVTKTKAAMRIVIPGKLLPEESELRIQWIDYYR